MQSPANVAVRVMDALLVDEHPSVEAPDFVLARKRYACVGNGGVRVTKVEEGSDFAEVSLVVHAPAELRINHAPAEFPPNWTVCLHRRDGVWTADRVDSPERQLAEELDRLPDRAARIAAIDRHPELSAEELSRRLTYLADFGHGRYDREVDLCNLALWLVEPVGPRRAIARALMYRGDGYYGLFRVPEAEAEI